MPSDSILFEAIGTKWQIDIEHQSEFFDKNTLLQEIKQITENFDLTYSRFRNDSLVTLVSKQKGEFIFPKNSNRLFELYWNFYTATNGKFTPLIGQTLADSGYDENYSLLPKDVIQESPDWECSICFDNRLLSTKKPVLLDFGAAGKGYLIDLLSEFLLRKDYQNFCIDGSGDICHRHSAKSIKIGLENPSNPEEVIGIAEISNRSLCASAVNRRRWQNYHHIIDPDSRSSSNNIIATWVIASETGLADGLATSLFLTPAEQLKDYFDFEYVVLNQDMSYEKSADFPGELFKE